MSTTGEHYDALDDFAGPGGWDEGARMIGLRLFGVDHDKAACQTATTAGHARETADVTTHPSPEWARGRGHVSSPSCTLFSMAGTGIGRLVLDTLADGIRDILHGQDPATVRDRTRDTIFPVALAEAQRANAKRKKPWPPEEVAEKAREDAKTTALVLEPARRIVELDPAWVALEQVPEVLPLWQVYMHELRAQGWSCFALVLNAADYGVPQTRRRAIFGASRVRKIAPPTPTHAEYPQDADLFGGTLQRWISMAEALEPHGWEVDDAIRPARGAGFIQRHGERPDHPGNEPAPTVISKARSWVRVNNRTSTTGDYYRRDTTRPAPTTVTATNRWVFGQSAPVITCTRRSSNGMLVGRQLLDGKRDDVSGEPGGVGPRGSRRGAVRVSVQEAAVLQSFPHDYPWQGSPSKQHEQVGNAIPPLLAAHILAAVTGRALHIRLSRQTAA